MKTGARIPSLNGVAEWRNGVPDPIDLTGHPVLVHFWSVSCGQGKETMPNVTHWRDHYRDRGLRVVGVHMPRSDADIPLGPIDALIADHDLTHPQALDADHVLVDRFENQYVPAFYVFDLEGNLRHYQSGDRGLKILEGVLERLMDGAGHGVGSD